MTVNHKSMMELQTNRIPTTHLPNITPSFDRSMDSMSGLPLAGLFSMLTILGILGNLIVIYAIAGDKKMRRSVMNILLLNLAVADLLNLVFTTSEWFSPVTSGTTQWLLPAFLCPICRYLECVFLFTSISTQVIVCIERYLAIIYPLRARLYCSRPNAFLAVLIAWTFSAIFAAPYAYLNYYKSKSEQCVNSGVRSPWWMRYKMAEFISFYLVPILLIVSVYLRIATVLWAKDPQLIETQHLETQKKASDSLRTRRNVVKMLVACVFVYFICYSPIQVIFLSKALLNVTIHPPYEFILIFNALAMTCSASNPLLYTLFSTKFRRRLRELLACGHRSTSYFSKDYSGASPRPTQISNYYALNHSTIYSNTANNNNNSNNNLSPIKSPTKCHI